MRISEGKYRRSSAFCRRSSAPAIDHKFLPPFVLNRVLGRSLAPTITYRPPFFGDNMKRPISLMMLITFVMPATRQTDFAKFTAQTQAPPQQQQPPPARPVEEFDVPISIKAPIHFHISDRNSLNGSEGIPFVFDSFEVVGHWPENYKPAPSKFETQHHRMELPLKDRIVSFPER
jgi:hypothetical protein